MSSAELRYQDRVVFDRVHLDRMVELLARGGYQVIGPKIREGAVVYDEVSSSAEFPVGWADEQSAGGYRLKRRPDAMVFGYTVGPQSWKRFLQPPVLRLWRASRHKSVFTVEPNAEAVPRYAFVGVRACDLRAIRVLDKVFLSSTFADPCYRQRRADAVIVAVQCGEAGASCFCASMGAGPKAGAGFDLALTEILEPSRHYFVAEIGSTRGADLMSELPFETAGPEDIEKAERRCRNAAAAMGRSLGVADLRELLQRNAEHRHWDEVSRRCLCCANCTMVCPTCFCATIEDVTDLSGEVAERWRKWDSCFTMEFSYIHGGSVRYSERARYRQWITHKLANWVDQFGMFGCVGCGRCITWCPVGIDITEEVRAIRNSDSASRAAAD
jgi:sulfhydrogenase subunit beta (sulfur reductase)